MIGQTLGHYRILEKIGAGGMGEVYRAHDERLDRDVALKFLSERLLQDTTAVDRFIREARAASALNHPNIITVHEIAEAGLTRYIVMELVGGRTLRQPISEGLSYQSIVQILGQVTQALSAAHAAGIVHRDIKPENIMVRDDGYVKVLDFGLARLSQSSTTSLAETAKTTQPGSLLGTARYMSPEQARSEQVGPETDIFSLGVVFYELATGQHPFGADSAIGVLTAIIFQAPTSPSRLNPSIPTWMGALILQMLEKDPRRRPNAREVQTVLSGRHAASKPTLEHFPAKPHTVAREKELAELLAGFESAVGGHGLLLCVTGEPGIGKTTLVEDFLAEVIAGGQTCCIARGRCSERLAGTEAYLPFLEAVESLFQNPAHESVVRLMKLLAPTWYAEIRPLSESETSAVPVIRGVKAPSQEKMKRELAAFCQELSRLQPLILFFDDLHWADISTTDLLSYLASRLPSMRVLVVLTYRPSELLMEKHPFVQVQLELQARGICREISLRFLERGDIETYLALEFPGHRFPTEFGAVVRQNLSRDQRRGGSW